MYTSAALAAISDALVYMNSRITEIVGYLSLRQTYAVSMLDYKLCMQESQAVLFNIQQQFVGKPQLGAPGRVSHMQTTRMHATTMWLCH